MTKKYILGRNLILCTTLADFIIVFGHTFDHQFDFDFLLIGNFLSHIVALFFFTGIAIVFYGLIFKKEYVDYKFSWWDLLAVSLILLSAQDYWYTIATPHPLFHEKYGI